MRSNAAPEEAIGEGRMNAQPHLGSMCPMNAFKKVFFKASEEIGCIVAASYRNFIRRTYNMVLQISIKTTNQSSRKTVITAMDEAGLEARHIIRASGCKNEASV